MTNSLRVEELRRELRQLQKELAGQLTQLRDRRRAPLVRAIHEVQSMLDPINPYASQAGQDRVVNRIFKGKRNGSFVDVGAYDGRTGSNSLFFERERGWHGVLIEPVDAQREKASLFRSSPCLGCAISAVEGKASFLSIQEGFTQMSGLLNEYDPQLLDRVRGNDRHEEVEIQVETKTLSRVLNEQDLTNPDFISLDIEGAELSVLQGFPFAEHRVGVWSIENNSGSSDIATVMRSNGYKLIEYCGPDEVYALEELI